MTPQDFVNWLKDFVSEDDSVPNKREWYAILELLWSATGHIGYEDTQELLKPQATEQPATGYQEGTDWVKKLEENRDELVEKILKEWWEREKEQGYVFPMTSKEFPDPMFSPYYVGDFSRFEYDPYRVQYSTSKGGGV